MIDIESTLRVLTDGGVEFTLVNSLGDLDLLGELTGAGDYEELLEHSIPVSAHGLEIRVLGLEKLIQVKRAVGRPQDLEAIAELETIRAERQKLGLALDRA